MRVICLCQETYPHVIFFYSFSTCIARSGNAILQSIMNSDALYTSPLGRHWQKMLYVYSYTFVFYMDEKFGNKLIELN